MKKHYPNRPMQPHRALLCYFDGCLRNPPSSDWDAHFTGKDPYNPKEGELEWVHTRKHSQITNRRRRKYQQFVHLSPKEYIRKTTALHQRVYYRNHPEKAKEATDKYRREHKDLYRFYARRKYWRHKYNNLNQLGLKV